MYTSIVLVALAGSSLSAADLESVQFKTDYVAARKMGKGDRKPLAVFIGNGAKGWEQRTTDGQLSPETQKLLQANYVCVYVDTTTDAGKSLARDFEMKEGIVLGDAQGENQAFRHTGKLSNSDLETQLKKYADPSRVAVRTETLTREDVRYYPAEASGTTTSGYYAPPGYPSSPAPGYCPSCSSGSCPNCPGGYRR
jgi:hypothetical protein